MPSNRAMPRRRRIIALTRATAISSAWRNTPQKIVWRSQIVLLTGGGMGAVEVATRADGKILSLFEPATEVIRKGRAGKPDEFGKKVKLQEAENQIVTDYEVYDQRPSDWDLLIGAVEAHQARLGRTPRLVAADAAFYSAKNEVAAKAKGVKRVCIPNRSTKSAERKREQKKRWFRNGQKWRTGCEGRISVIKRRHGLSRCRYKGDAGMKRWVGLGVIADNVINIGHPMEKQSHR